MGRANENLERFSGTFTKGTLNRLKALYPGANLTKVVHGIVRAHLQQAEATLRQAGVQVEPIQFDLNLDGLEEQLPALTGTTTNE